MRSTAILTPHPTIAHSEIDRIVEALKWLGLVVFGAANKQDVVSI